MTATDTFQLSASDEAEAQDLWVQMRCLTDRNVANGYLAESVAIFLSKPRWSRTARRRLGIDYRVSELMRGK